MSKLLAAYPLLSYPFFVEIFFAISGLVLLVIGAFKGDKFCNQLSWLTSFVLFLGFVVMSQASFNLSEVMSLMFKFNFFIFVVKSMVILSAILCMILFIGHSDYNIKNSRFEYPVLILFSVLGMLIMISANDFLTLYMGLELQSLAIYILVAINKDNLKSSEAALKYFVLGSLATGILLFGISLIYGTVGSIFFEKLSLSLLQNSIMFENQALLIVGLVMIIVGLAFKVSAVPFHMWTPDVYEGSPTPVTVFVSSAPKIAAFVIMLRVLYEPFATLQAQWQDIIMMLAVISLIVGSLGALRQQNFKRLLAYSSINHIGFMLLAVSLYSSEAIESLLLYLAIYITMTVAAFAFLMIIKQSHASADSADKKPLEDLSAYSGLSKMMPITAISLAIIMLSQAGIPPFAGFFGKLYVFKAVIENGHYTLAIIAAISAVIAAFYYLRIIKIMFFDEQIEKYNKKPSLITLFIFAIMVLINSLFFIKPAPIIEFIRVTAQSIYQ